MAQLCAQALVANMTGYLPAHTTCSGTELALFMRDVTKLGAAAAIAKQTLDSSGVTTATCLGCAYTGGYLNDTFSTTDINKECEDDVFTSVGTVADCLAEVQLA